MLKFSLFGVPVAVHFSFLLVALLGYPELQGAEIVAWTVAVFVAVLLHEAGHAFTARRFGASPVTITLFALGGVTMYPADRRLTAWQRFAISAAGSAVGIIAGGATWLLYAAGSFDTAGRLLRIGLGSFVFASLFWGVLNWLPIRPLDGSHMVRSVLDAVTPVRAGSIASAISLVTGVGAVVVAFAYGQYFAALFAAFLTLTGLRGDDRTPVDPAGHQEPAGSPRNGADAGAESAGAREAPQGVDAASESGAPTPPPRRAPEPDPPVFPI